MEVSGLTADDAWEIAYDGKKKAPAKIYEFASKLIEGTVKEREYLDDIILKYAKNWEMERIALVDKVIIRLGLYEIFFEDAIPRNASINEAVELAKYYSTAKSHKFVNGILDSSSLKEENRIVPKSE